MDIRQLRARFDEFTRPGDLGLPNWRVLSLLFVLLAVPFAVLVAFGITGSSTGYLFSLLSSEPDPRLILWSPRPIRSDEWLVHSGWVISQVEQGLPLINHSLFGGVSTSFLQEIPTFDWSVIFRPQLWGFFFLPVDQAAAFKWWLPMFLLIAAALLLFISLSPRRPLSGMALAFAFAFNPFFQWWFFTGTFLPAAWALFAGTTVLWCVRGVRLKVRIALAVLLGYSLVGMTMGLYVPFIYAAALPGLALALGFLFDRSHYAQTIPLLVRLRSTIPLFVGLFIGASAVALWLLSNWDLVEKFTGTVYPGAREIPTGGADWSSWISLFAGPYSLSLFGGDTLSLLGPNSSEAATFFLPGLFLLPPLVWLAVKRYRGVKKIDWLVGAQLILLIIVLSFLIIPGWDDLAKLLSLQLLSPGRNRMLFGVMSFILVSVFVARLDYFVGSRGGERARIIPIWVRLFAPVLAFIVALILGLYFMLSGAGITVGGFGLRSALVLTVVVVAFFIGGLAFVAWRKTFVGAALLLLAALATTASVNPLYLGLYSLGDTEIAKYVQTLDQESNDKPTWVAVGGFMPATVLMHAGVSGMNGVQTVPQSALWDLIDPEKQFESAWNRLGNISWIPGAGEPIPTNPAADQIQVNFDSCSKFAQEYVTYVLSDAPIDQQCVSKRSQIDEGSSTFYVYEVTPQ